MKKFLCILMCMLMVLAFMPTMAFAGTETDSKIEVSVKSGGAILSAEVNEEYEAKVILPTSSTEINFESATVSATVTGLQKLGMGAADSRHESKTITTNSKATATVAEYFGRAYDFATRTVNVSVGEKGKTMKDVEYTVESNGEIVTAKPSGTGAAADVWAEFASYTTLTNVAEGHKASTPTSIKAEGNTITAEFATGSSVQIGTSQLALKDGYKATVTVKGVTLTNAEIENIKAVYNDAKDRNISSSAENAKSLLEGLKTKEVAENITVTVTFEKVETKEPTPRYIPWGGGYVAPQQPEPEKTLAEKIDEAEDQLNAYIADNTFKARSTKQTKLHGKTAIKVSWNKVEGADGYEVFKSTKRYSGFGKTPYFTTTKTTYTNNKELKKGKTYYYKVRAYKLVDGKKAYSDWSLKAWRTIK